MNRGICSSLCSYGGAWPPPPKPLWVMIKTYPSLPEPRRCVVVVHVCQIMSIIKYNCYRNIPHSAPPNPPGLGLYPSIHEP